MVDNKTKLNSIKSGLREYINTLITLNEKYEDTIKPISTKLLVLRNIDYMLINLSLNEKQISELRNEIIQTEKDIKDIINKRTLTEREQSLIDRGYDIDDVKRLTYFSSKEMEYISDYIYSNISKGCKKNTEPVCLFLGGQPGAGKSSRSMELKNNSIENGTVEIGIDNYRTYHPHYLEIEKIIKEYWKDKTPDNNNSPGNDIVDFTHKFAGDIADILIEKASNDKYNIILEWGMREPTAPLKAMKDLKEKNYKNIVDFIAVDKNISLEACKIRADIMDNQEHIVRRVPDSFHELCISSLPDSCEEIYNKGYLQDKIIDSFTITTRDKKVVWNPLNKTSPKEIYTNYLNNQNLSKDITNDITYAEKTYKTETSGIGNKEIIEMLDDNINIYTNQNNTHTNQTRV